MNKIITIIALAAITLTTAAVTLTWDPNPADEQVTSYTVYQATNVTGPFLRVVTVTGTNAVLNLDRGKYFFYVTASNFWGESLPSNTVNTPPGAGPVKNPKVDK